MKRSISKNCRQGSSDALIGGGQNDGISSPRDHNLEGRGGRRPGPKRCELVSGPPRGAQGDREKMRRGTRNGDWERLLKTEACL